MIKRVAGLVLVSAFILGLGIMASRAVRALVEATADDPGAVPTTTVRRGDVEITVTTRGELEGGSAERLVAPRTGAVELPIIYIRDTGELVEAGDVIVEFDPSGQDYDLIEAQADLAEAEQELIKAEAEARIALEETRLQVGNADADLRLAELEMRKNEVLGTIQQRQNEISYERAKNRHAQAVSDLENKEATTTATIEGQRAAVTEATEKAQTARRTVQDLTLRAPKSGYVQLSENTSGISSIYTGMVIPTYQVGDTVRPGQLVAQIPDMSRWEANTQIPETDRAFLEVGQSALIRPKAMPGREFRGHVSLLGGSTGSAWERSFNCRIALDETDPDLRPGMSLDLVIRVETLENVLWLPSQAVFEREGRRFVYRQTPEGYITEEVTLLRRTESQAVITGIEEGATIALAEPGRGGPTAGSSDGPLGALPQ